MTEKIVEAVGRGKVNLGAALGALSGEKMKPSIARVRVVKKRDGQVYEDQTIEYKAHGFNG